MKKNFLFVLAVILTLACTTASAADTAVAQREIDILMERNRTAGHRYVYEHLLAGR